MSGLKLGIVGFGRIVELTHLPVLAKQPDVEVSGIYDLTPKRLELAARRGFRTFERLEALWASEAQAVLIATPPSSHYALAAQALSHGKHVLIEKPIALDSGEAERLSQLARENRLIVSVVHNRRFDDDFRLVRQVIESGELGEILFVERRCHRFGSGASFGVPSFHPGWRNETAYGGGALMDWGVHLADQLLQLGLGAWQSVEASMQQLRWNKGETEECVQARIRLDNGIWLSMDIHFGSHAASPLWIVGGDRGTLRVEENGEAAIYGTGQQPGRVVPDFPVGGYRKDYEGTRRIHASFASCLRGEGELEVTLEQAIEGMRLLDAIRMAAADKREVRYGDIVRGASVGV
ncbi:Gfo/Idh/MocA family protein [Cohnella boryungensis]|uniref:Gfo/Idh/MocA family protein n=1 Tax=Cohnella boryungensis TaxID=768479 RepID=A0ABV8SC82_9BACL